MLGKDTPKYLNTDQECVIRAQKGECDTIRILYERYHKSIVQYIYYKIGDEEDAKDIASKVFIKVVEKIDTIKKPESFQKWLYTIVRNQIKNYYASKSLRIDCSNQQINEEGEDVLDNIPANTDNPMFDSVQQVLKQLKPQEQQAIILHTEKGLTYSEIGRLFGKSEAASKKMVLRAQVQFRKRYLQKFNSPIYLGGEKNEREEVETTD